MLRYLIAAAIVAAMAWQSAAPTMGAIQQRTAAIEAAAQ